MSSNRFLLLALIAFLSVIASCGEKDDGKGEIKPAETADLLVCTFNIRFITDEDGEYAWKFRKDAVCKFILTRKPDLVGLQEVEKESAQYIFSKVKDEYGFYGVGPTTGKDILEVEDGASANAVLYRKDRFDLSAKGAFWHSDTPDQVVVKNKANDYGSWHTTHSLNTVWVKLADKDHVGRPVWLFNTHFQNNKNCPNAADLRMLETNLHLTLMPQITGGSIGQGSKEAVFLVGDFNSKAESDELQRLINYPFGYARQDAAKSSFRSTDTYNGYGKGGSLIDHLFFCGPLKCLNYTVDKRDYGILYISDHYPVLSEFAYND